VRSSCIRVHEGRKSSWVLSNVYRTPCIPFDRFQSRAPEIQKCRRLVADGVFVAPSSVCHPVILVSLVFRASV
jgi:hypothetical protein